MVGGINFMLLNAAVIDVDCRSDGNGDCTMLVMPEKRVLPLG